MEHHRAYKFRIYPTEEQQLLLARFFGSKRWIFNHYLSENKGRFERKEAHLSLYDINKEITKQKKAEDTAWLSEIDDWCLKNAAADLDAAYKNFFNSLKGKRKGKKVEAPKFKNRHSRQSYRTRTNVRIVSGKLFLPKLKWIDIEEHRPLKGEPCSVTVSKTPSGKYFVSILVKEDIELLPSTDRAIGIDLGLKDLMIMSDGTKVSNPRFLTKTKQDLGRAQKILARKTKGSKKYERRRVRVAKYHEKVVNQRQELYHNISRWLVNEYDFISLESLNVKGMVKNRKLSRAISDASWSTLVSMIEYKAGWAGKTVARIDTWFPSSKTCSCCGHKKSDLTLDIREWTCVECGAFHDRDLNAAQNILNEGLHQTYQRTDLFQSNDGTGVQIPEALQKLTSKIERSHAFEFVSGAGKHDPFMGSCS